MSATASSPHCHRGAECAGERNRGETALTPPLGRGARPHTPCRRNLTTRLLLFSSLAICVATTPKNTKMRWYGHFEQSMQNPKRLRTVRNPSLSSAVATSSSAANSLSSKSTETSKICAGTIGTRFSGIPKAQKEQRACLRISQQIDAQLLPPSGTLLVCDPVQAWAIRAPGSAAW